MIENEHSLRPSAWLPVEYCIVSGFVSVTRTAPTVGCRGEQCRIKVEFYAMARDETEQKHAEDGLREAQQELERVSRQTTLGAMTASIAHEINQPLSAIVANGNAGLRWLARKDFNLDEVQEALQRIVDDGLRAADIITSIRGLFRKDSHEKLQLSVNDLVHEVRRRFTAIWKDGKSSLEANCTMPFRKSQANACRCSRCCST